MKIEYILSTFEKKDWHWFGKFLSSPVFNQNLLLNRIFIFFRKNKNEKKNDINPKNLFQSVFPNEAFNRDQLHYALGYFTRCTENYLAWDEWENDRDTQQLYLLRACRKRNIPQLFSSVFKKTQYLLQTAPRRDSHYYRLHYALEMEAYQQGMYAGRSSADQLQPLFHWHDVAFVAEKLRNACLLLSRKKVQNVDLDTGLLPAVLDLVSHKKELLEYPAVAVYYHGYLTLSEPEKESHFFALKNGLPSAREYFNADELRDIYLLATNFCIHRINLRQDAYLRELLELYQTGLSAGVFLENGFISRFTYTNIALLALRMKEYQWGHDFIERWKDKLPETQRQGAWALNLARYYCETGHFDLAMPLLQEMNSDDVLHNLMAKTMLLRMYYDTGAHNALQSLLDSFEAYLRRKRQMGNQQYTAYRNTIRFVRKMSRLPPGQKKARHQLRSDIVATELVAEKEWLLQRI